MLYVPFTPAPPRVHRKRSLASSSTVPTLPLMLVSATYDPDFSSVTLTFNQVIETGDMVLSVIVLNDETYSGQTMIGMSTIGQTANSVTVEMEIVSPASGSGVKLTVDTNNGIAPAGGGDAWAGVNELALPFVE